MKKINLLIIVLIIIIAIIFGFIIYQNQNKVQKEENTGLVLGLETFARCLTASGAKFYGAYWCGHCKSQKEKFGEAFKYIQYVECAEGNGQAEVCREAGITGYPTWIFGDGSKKMGEISLEELGEKAGCNL